MRRRSAVAAAIMLVCAKVAAASGPSWTEVPAGGIGYTKHWNGTFAWNDTEARTTFIGCAIGESCSGFMAVAGQWTPFGASGPDRRSSFAAAFDSTTGTWVMFGGAGLTGYSDETWALSSSGWVQAPAGPPPRFDASMAFDSARRRMVLFGGSALMADCAAGVCGDTWEYDGTWKKLAPPVRPPARDRAAMVWNPVSKLTFLVGGESLSECFDDTWSWDGASWAPVVSAHRPTAGRPMTATWDAGRNRVVLVVTGEGCGAGSSTSTWEWYDDDWHEVPVSTPYFMFADNSLNFAFDSARGELVGGDGLQESIWTYGNPLDNGAACGLSVGCAEGHCTRGLCCNSACEGSCSTCAAAEGAALDGTCGVRARGSPGAPACAPYRCDGRSPACPSACIDDVDCASTARCDSGQCVALARCSDDGLSLLAGEQRSCRPYRCREAACLSECTTGADCAPGNVCSTAGACVEPGESAADSGSCSVGRKGGPAWLASAALVFAAGLLARRRPR